MNPTPLPTSRRPGRIYAELALLLGLSLTQLGCFNSSPLRQDDADRRSAWINQRLAPSQEAAASAAEQAATLYGQDAPNFIQKNQDTIPTSTIYEGTGHFVQSVGQPPPAAAPGQGDNDITLNFENTDIREVVKIILGDVLQENYILDPKVRGNATLQTSRPLQRVDLLPTLETLLRMNGAALVRTQDGYRVLPVAEATQGLIIPQLGGINQPLPSGYRLQLMPLRYVSVAEMAKILEPLAPKGSIVRSDPLRNLLVLAGSSHEINNLVDTIRVFDVDWMSGLSVGFFPLINSEADEIISELNLIFGKDGDDPMAGLFRFVPMESVNGILVVTPQRKYLLEIEKWIRRLDELGPSSGDAERLYVYRVRNGNAEELAGILNELIGGGQRSGKPDGAKLAPGLASVTIESGGEAAAPKEDSKPGAVAVSVSGIESRIVADVKNNSLIILAKPREYNALLSALEKLDIIPLQVLVEATIVEVRLTGELRYGLQWFFKSSLSDYGMRWVQNSTGSAGNPLATFSSGFNWTLLDDEGIARSVLNLFANDGNVEVLSSPSVMVLDNHTARIQVGDEVPISTQQQQSTSTGSSIINSIEYRSTGVLLTVTPRVNPGGMVVMEIEQEVSDVSTVQSSDLDSPTISTRNINSTVAVKDGQAVVLGGLITDSRERGDNGLPYAKDVPVFGWMFGQKSNKDERTELVVLLTPRVIRSGIDINQINEDFRSRLSGLEGRF